MATGVFTNGGHGYTVDVLDPATRAAAAVPSYHLAWGSGTGVLNVTNATLTEHPEPRVAAQVRQQDTNGVAQADMLRLTAQITATGNRNVSEAGYFTAATGGIMLARVLFPTIPIETGDRLEADVALHFTDSSE